MIDSILNLVGRAVCSSEIDLAVQVTGIGHVANPLQTLAIKLNGNDKAHYSHDNDEINKNKEAIPSTIFKWPDAIRNRQEQKQLVLEVPTAKGGKITLPLCDDLQICGSWPDAYFLANRLHSIVPIYRFDAYADYYGAARAGYIYIFVGDTLWRELLISRDENGENTFQDIDLAHYRDGAHRYRAGAREAVGVALNDIWVPAYFLNHSAPQVSIAYADVQWSGERINYLQTHQAERLQRTTAMTASEQSIISQITAEQGETAPKIAHNQTALFTLSLLPATRARDEAIEFFIDHPAHYLTNADYLRVHQQKSQSAIERFLADHDTVKQLALSPCNHTDIDMSAVQYHLLAAKQPYAAAPAGEAPPANQRTIDEENIFNSLEPIWTNPTPFSDSLQELKARGILGALIADPNYPVTCAKERIKLLASTFTTVCVAAQTHPYYRLASLIEKQRKIVAEFEKGISKQMSPAGRQQYDKAVAGPIRRELHRRINYHKHTLARYLGADSGFQQAMADGFSNHDNPVDVIGHFAHIAETLNLLSLSMASYDPLLPIEAENDPTLFGDTNPNQVVQAITTDIHHPLHQMLYPQATFDSLLTPYTPVAQCDNQGDGLFNEGLWCAISNNAELLDQAPATLNGAAINRIRQQGEVLLTSGQFPNFKAMNALLYSLIDDLANARKRAQENLLQHRQDYRTASAELQLAQQELTRYRREQHKVSNLREDKAQQLAMHEQRIAAAENKLAQIEQAYQAKLQQLGAIKARIPVKELAQLRITGGSSFRNLQVRLASEVNIAGSTSAQYYVLGTIDHVQRPTSDLKRNYSLFDKEIAFDGATKGKRADVYLIVMPEDDPYVKLRKKQLQAQIPELEAEINHRRAAVAHLEGELVPLKNKGIIAAKSTERAKRRLDTQLSRTAQTGSLLRQTEQTINSRIKTIAARIEKTGVLPPALLGLEIINVTLLTISLKDFTRTRGKLRAYSGYFAALSDTSVAAIAVLEMLQNQHQLFAKHTPIAKGLKALGKKSELLAKLSLEKATFRTIPIGLLAILNTALSIWDAYHAFRHGDDAVYGHTALALSGAASIMGALAGAGASVWFGPAGWIVAAVLLLAAGIVLLWQFSDTELEQWFKQGPFGEYDRYPDLKLADRALAVLLNMLFRPTLAIESNPFQAQARQQLANPDVKRLAPEHIAILHNVSKANTCIVFHSELMGFADTDTVIHYACRLYRYRHITRASKFVYYIRTYDSQLYDVLHSEITPNGAILFVHTPESSHAQGYVWLGAMQVSSEFIAANSEAERRYHYFPAPAFTERKPYTPLTDATPLLALPATTSGVKKAGSASDITKLRGKLQQDFWHKLIIEGDTML